jgi:hypothetical protein
MCCVPPGRHGASHSRWAVAGSLVLTLPDQEQGSMINLTFTDFLTEPDHDFVTVYNTTEARDADAVFRGSCMPSVPFTVSCTCRIWLCQLGMGPLAPTHTVTLLVQDTT